MLKEKVLKTIKKYRMFEKGDKVVMGVSGGPDSIALTYILNSLREEYDLTLYIAHLNHMIRPVEAEKEVRFLRDVSNRLGIPFFIKHENVPDFIKERKVSPEAGAREVRYAFFNETIQNLSAGKLALGHNLDDQAETVLLNLFRGSGRTGLGAILPVNEKIVRPLIECSKKEILDFLEENKIEYCVDSSNLEPVYQRNKIRLELMPLIEKDYNPNIKETLFRTSMIFQQEDLYLEMQAQKHAQHVLKKGKGNEAVIIVKEFKKIHPAFQPRVLREAIRRIKGDVLQLSFLHIEDLSDLINNKPSGSNLNLPEDIVAFKEYERIRIRKAGAGFIANSQGHAGAVSSSSKHIEDRYIIKKTVSNRNKPITFYRANHDTAYFDANKIGFSFFIRTKKDGDRFLPQGAQGKKKLSDFFIDHKVSREARESIPLLISSFKKGKFRENKIIWVVGYRISEEVKVTDKTKKIMKIQIFRKA